MSPLTSSDAITRKVAGIHRVVMYTDGFEAKEDLLRQANMSFADIYALLRAEEKKDGTLNATPRFKPSDDASAVAFKFS